MKIKILRYKKRGVACDGVLLVDGERICDTAENVQYMPLAGEYDVVLLHSKVHGRKVPVLVAQSGRASPQAGSESPCLAMGNGIYNRTDGRIILGKYIAPGCVGCSRKPFMLLYDRINNVQRRGHKVRLTITDCT